MRRRLMKALAALAVLVAVVAAAVFWYLRQSLPAVNASVAVAGITAPIEIVRDADAVPHIIASTRLDALFGLGYVHAQDRLWQMEFQRRVGFGRLSEVFGAATIPQDRFLRTVGYGRAARAAWTGLPGDAKAAINAYVAGVNAFLAGHQGRLLPPEFSLLRFEPEPWKPEDVIVWVKMMAWDLSANYAFELLRRDLMNAVGAERAAQLMPPLGNSGPSILSSLDTPWRHRAAPANAGLRPEPGHVLAANATDAFTSALTSGDRSVADFLIGGTRSEAIGSNNWVVDGTLTASGKPLLANDPHLATRLPSTWYLAHMSAGDFDVIGATIPGAPAVALGRNRFIAWGATNVAADVQDLYRERLDESGRFAEFEGRQEPLQLIEEPIRVKGGDTINLTVRISRHGPLVSDAINANNAESRREPRPGPVEPLALRWTALDPDDTTVTSFLALNTAHNWKEFTDALRRLVVPSQNFVYADVSGHIGYYAPGRIPIRAAGDGSRPADGWSGEPEWTGWIPFDELPHTYDPPEHLIVTANNRPAPEAYPYLLGLEWPEPYRAARITARLHGHSKMTPDDFASIQADTFSLQARDLLGQLLAHVKPVDASDAQAVAMLRQWNGDARGDSAVAAIYESWFLRLAPALVGDELGPLALRSYEGRFSSITRMLRHVLASNDSPWCDDVRTPARETCEDMVSIALHQAMAQLRAQLGDGMNRWRWDAVHHAVFPHQGLDAMKLLRPFVSRSVPTGGDWSTVDVGPVSADQPFEQRQVPGYRQIIDLSDRNDSRFLADVGQSGHPLSVHYDDFLADWRAVRYRPMRMSRSAIDRSAAGRLELVPVAGRQ